MKRRAGSSSSVLFFVGCAGSVVCTVVAAQTPVKDLDPGISSTPAGFVEWRGDTYFQAFDAAAGPTTLRRRLWRTDGTSAGTVPLAPGKTDWRFVEELTPTRRLLFFTATTDASGTELWATDGTPAGTRMVKDIGPGAHDGGVRELCAVGDTLYFVAHTVRQTPFGPLYGGNPELWRSDGTAAGTRLVTDLTPGWAAVSSQISDLVEHRGVLYFLANPSRTSRGLWRSDGSAAGTAEVAFIKTAGKPAITRLVVTGGSIYFLDDGDLWWSFGTANLTLRLASGSFSELWPGTSQVYLRDNKTLVGWNGNQAVTLVTLRAMEWFQVVGDRLYFRGDDNIHGREPWTSDGTVAGTHLVVDLLPGSGSGMEAPDRYADPRYFEAIGSAGSAVFVGTDGTNGLQIYLTDGTAAGTRRLTNLRYASVTHGPVDFHRHGEQVFFRCYDTGGDMELWAMPVGRTAVPVAEPYGLGCRSSASATTPRIGTTGAPTLGNASFAITLDGGRGGAAAVLMLGLRRAPLAWFGCQLAVQPVILGPWSTTNANGQVVAGLAVPASTALLGQAIAFQWGVLDPQGGFFGFASLSDGLHVVVGR